MNKWNIYRSRMGTRTRLSRWKMFISSKEGTISRMWRRRKKNRMCSKKHREMEQPPYVIFLFVFPPLIDEQSVITCSNITQNGNRMITKSICMQFPFTFQRNFVFFSSANRLCFDILFHFIFSFHFHVVCARRFRSEIKPFFFLIVIFRF